MKTYFEDIPPYGKEEPRKVRKGCAVLMLFYIIGLIASAYLMGTWMLASKPPADEQIVKRAKKRSQLRAPYDERSVTMEVLGPRPYLNPNDPWECFNETECRK